MDKPTEYITQTVIDAKVVVPVDVADDPWDDLKAPNFNGPYTSTAVLEKTISVGEANYVWDTPLNFSAGFSVAGVAVWKSENGGLTLDKAPKVIVVGDSIRIFFPQKATYIVKVMMHTRPVS